MEATTQERENISFKWKGEIIEKLKKLAEKENRSLNNYIETLLEKHLKGSK